MGEREGADTRKRARGGEHMVRERKRTKRVRKSSEERKSMSQRERE